MVVVCYECGNTMKSCIDRCSLELLCEWSKKAHKQKGGVMGEALGDTVVMSEPKNGEELY